MRWIVFLAGMAMAGAASAEPQILWNQLIKGEGKTQFTAVADLVQRTAEKEMVLLRDCERVYGQPLWSEIEYSTAGERVYAHQDFTCVRPDLEDAGASAETAVWTLSKR